MNKNPTNILVTGGCGFIASNFINYYYYLYPNSIIVNVDAMYYCADINNINKDIRDSNRYHFAKGNINQKDYMKFVLEKYNIDTIIHFAAQSHVQNSFDDSLQFTMDNILGTHNLLEAAREYGGFSGIDKNSSSVER